MLKALRFCTLISLFILIALPLNAEIGRPFSAFVWQNLSLRQVLGKSANDPLAFSLRRLYQTHNFQPLWSHAGSPSAQALALVDVIAHADSHGLNPDDYDGSQLQDWLAHVNTAQSSADEAWSVFDVALSRALMRFADHLYRGRIAHAALSPLGIDIPVKAPLNFVRLLDELSQAADPGQTLARLEPDTEVYRALKAALPQYQALAKRPRLMPLTLGKSLHPGEAREHVPVLRDLLQLYGYTVDEPAPVAADLYDDALAEAVRHFQAQHGIEPDAIVGGQTLLQLNITPSARVEQIRLGLERLRWLPEQYNSAYLIVNVPSFRLYGFTSGAPDLSQPDIGMDVIVGQAIDTHNTPIFHADMQSIVFRPYWNVPYNIAHTELLPLIEKTSDYMAKNDMEVISNDGISADSDPSQAMLDAVDAGQFRLRQRPGPKNALGPIKFVFPNMNSVYMHGTPKQQLFQRARRDLSHGCIRLSDPASLAEFVLKKEHGWDRQRIESAMQGDKSFSVRLSRNIPVYIFYTTALADEQGQVLFYPDIYGQDAALLKLLNGQDG